MKLEHEIRFRWLILFAPKKGGGPLNAAAAHDRA